MQKRPADPHRPGVVFEASVTERGGGDPSGAFRAGADLEDGETLAGRG